MNITIEKNFREFANLAIVEQEYRSKRQYFEHSDISRFTSYLNCLLKSKYKLNEAVNKLIMEINKYNLEHKDNPLKKVLPPNDTEFEKLFEKTTDFIRLNHKKYNIPLYQPDEIKKYLEQLRTLGIEQKSDYLRASAINLLKLKKIPLTEKNIEKAEHVLTDIDF